MFAQYGVDYVIGETFEHFGEAVLALEVIQEFKLPSVVTMASLFADGRSKDGYLPHESCQILREKGADVVGLNCSRGPATMMPLLKQIKAHLGDGDDVHIAALPVCYRTTKENPSFQSWSDDSAKYTELDCHCCTRGDLCEFAKEAMAMGINYIGTCCGGAPHHVRSMAEAVGKPTISSEFSPDLDLHFVFSEENSTGLLNEKYLEFKHLWGTQRDSF